MFSYENGANGGYYEKIISIIYGLVYGVNWMFKWWGHDSTDEGKKVELEIGVEKSYVPYFEEVTETYTEEHPNVTFKVTESKMFDILDSLEAQKGNSADIFMMPNDRVGDLAQKKLVADLGDVDLSKYTETAQTATEFEGGHYFLPFSTDTTLLLYNKTLTDSQPKTLKELNPKDWAAKFTDFYVAGGLFYSNGSYIFGDNTDDIGLNNEGAYATGKVVKELYNSGEDHWEALKEETAGYEQMVEKFAKGELTYIIDGPWKVADLVSAGLAEENIGAMPIPSWDGTNEYKPLTSTKGLAVNAYCKDKEEAINFIKSLATKENAEKWYTSTKEVNPHTEVVYEDGSLAKVVLDATSKGTSMPTDPAFGKVWVPMADALKQIANGGDVKESLDSAIEIIKNDIAAMNQ